MPHHCAPSMGVPSIPPEHPSAHIRYPIHHTRRLVTDALQSDGVDLGEWSSPRAGAGAGSSTNSPMGSLTDDGLGETPRASEDRAGPILPSTSAADVDDEGTLTVPLAGINDDGYFGDASGQWYNLEPNAEITLHGRADVDPWEEVKEFARRHGVSLAWGIVTVVVAVSALIWWSESVASAGERAAEEAAGDDGGPTGRRLLAGALGEAASGVVAPGLRAARKLLVARR